MTNEEDLRRHEVGQRIESEITETIWWALNPDGIGEPPEVSPLLIEEIKAIVDRLMTDHPERFDSSWAPGDLPLTTEQALDLIDALETGREEIAYVKLRCGGPFVSSKEIWRNNDGTFTIMHCIDGTEVRHCGQGLLAALTDIERDLLRSD